MTALPDIFPFNSDQSSAILRRVTKLWDDDIVPQLIDYVKLPSKSPAFAAHWKRAGQIQLAIARWRVAGKWRCRQPETRTR